jgi:hypothetical protein
MEQYAIIMHSFKEEGFKNWCPSSFVRSVLIFATFLSHLQVWKGYYTIGISRYIKLLPSCFCGLRHETELIFFDMSAWKDSLNKSLC